MTNMLRAAAACGLALLLAAPAMAQTNMSLRAPAWAQAMLATDVTPTTGGRAILAADGIDLSVRVTIAPTQGGVARVIRYDQRAGAGTLAVRRFTGHPSTGWWLWGSDNPRVTNLTAAQATEIAGLARAANGVAATLGTGEQSSAECASGEQAYVEMVVAGRSASQTRACVVATEVVGHLAARMSELAGSRTEEELAAAAVDELMSADRAFAARAAADGVPAAFAAYAAPDAIVVGGGTVSQGTEAITQRYANWPQGARLEWAPQGGRVSARGDMGWTWGTATSIAANGTRTQSRYVSVWTRDYEGNWRYAFDGALN